MNQRKFYSPLQTLPKYEGNVEYRNGNDRENIILQYTEWLREIQFELVRTQQ